MKTIKIPVSCVSRIFELAENADDKEVLEVLKRATDDLHNNKTRSNAEVTFLNIYRGLFPAHEIYANHKVQCGARNMFVDFFDKTLGLAIEVMGAQHYAPNSLFHRSKEDFRKGVVRDGTKKRYIEQCGYKYLSIRDTELTVDKVKELVNHVLRKQDEDNPVSSSKTGKT